MPLEDYAGAVLAVSFGSYPRAGDAPDDQKLRRAIEALDRGEVTAQELSAVERDVIKDVLAEQAEAGLDVVTDGQVRWHDPVSHLARSLEGCEVGGAVRWFDSDLSYQQPVITGPVRWQRPILLDDLEYAQAASDRPLKAVLTGPLTFVALSRDAHYGNPKEAVLALAQALNRELQSYEEIELAYVQIDEPAFGPATDRGLLRDAYAALLENVAQPVVVAPFFGDVSRCFTWLFDLPVAGWHLDLRSQAPNASALDGRRFPDGKILSLGVLDALSARLEDRAEAAREVDALRERLPESAGVLVTSNVGLEGLPRGTARQKLGLLCEIRDAVQARARSAGEGG
jgi:5-methyltetrahydropteroyltriglutamate--homocysteine methyltransferase